jgi:hypothetical protein
MHFLKKIVQSLKTGWTGDNTCEKKRKSLQKNKVFIFIAVLHLGETGSLTKLNLSKGMNFYITVWWT